jgi:hypothetical protein
MRFCLLALNTASVDVLAFSFFNIFVLWFFTVESEIPSFSAIALVLMPIAMYFKISFSLFVSFWVFTGSNTFSSIFRFDYLLLNKYNNP